MNALLLMFSASPLAAIWWPQETLEELRDNDTQTVKVVSCAPGFNQEPRYQNDWGIT